MPLPPVKVVDRFAKQILVLTVSVWLRMTPYLPNYKVNALIPSRSVHPVSDNVKRALGMLINHEGCGRSQATSMSAISSEPCRSACK